jgi:hypothetical protein
MDKSALADEVGAVGADVHRYFSYTVIPYESGRIAQLLADGSVVTPELTAQQSSPLQAE